jgi:hypothetical protein
MIVDMMVMPMIVPIVVPMMVMIVVMPSPIAITIRAPGTIFAAMPRRPPIAAGTSPMTGAPGTIFAANDRSIGNIVPAIAVGSTIGTIGEPVGTTIGSTVAIRSTIGPPIAVGPELLAATVLARARWPLNSAAILAGTRRSLNSATALTGTRGSLNTATVLARTSGPLYSATILTGTSRSLNSPAAGAGPIADAGKVAGSWPAAGPRPVKACRLPRQRSCGWALHSSETWALLSGPTGYVRSITHARSRRGTQVAGRPKIGPIRHAGALSATGTLSASARALSSAGPLSNIRALGTSTGPRAGPRAGLSESAAAERRTRLSIGPRGHLLWPLSANTG